MPFFSNRRLFFSYSWLRNDFQISQVEGGPTPLLLGRGGGGGRWLTTVKWLSLIGAAHKINLNYHGQKSFSGEKYFKKILYLKLEHRPCPPFLRVGPPSPNLDLIGPVPVRLCQISGRTKNLEIFLWRRNMGSSPLNCIGFRTFFFSRRNWYRCGSNGLIGHQDSFDFH